jgi:hypothetical protein
VLGARGAQELGALAVEEDRRAQVDGELEVDLLGRQLADRLAGADPGVVDQHVQPPGLRHGPRDQPVAVLPVGHVGGQVLAGAAAGPDEIVGGLAAGDRITADIGEQHPEAVRGEPDGDGPPDP